LAETQRLWQLRIEPAAGRADLEGKRVAAEAVDLGLPGPFEIEASRGFLIEGPLSRDDVRRAAEEALADPVAESFAVHRRGSFTAERFNYELSRWSAVTAAEKAVAITMDEVFPDARQIKLTIDPDSERFKLVVDGRETEFPDFGWMGPREATRRFLEMVRDAETADERAIPAIVPQDVPLSKRDYEINFKLLTEIRRDHDLQDRPGLDVFVMLKPGVTDPEGESAYNLLRDLGYPVRGVRSVRTYRIREGFVEDQLYPLLRRVLVNDAIEQFHIGDIVLKGLGEGTPYTFKLVNVPIRDMDDEALAKASRAGQLALSLDEMRAVRDHFEALGRDPTDCELETIAQTWSEHCSHKTLRGKVRFRGEVIDNLLKSTIFKATEALDPDWLVSVFKDNAGVVKFDDDHDVCFKVETHNHPSAIDPYGGANTGLGGVIRDPLGTGLGAKPICNTDVFCVAHPDTDPTIVPPGIIHPRRILEGVVAGVRDYGNRMGIPTVNGALVVDGAFWANPLVFCGTVGVLPAGKAHKEVRPGDRIVAVGGRTGRDGIHGATFSSLELSGKSEELSGGAVQIGNAITEKMVLDVVLRARDAGLFRSITDCGAGGFSSAVGEMGAGLGAEVDLEKAPLKYTGLSYTEIWISEAQERMVLAVPPEHLAELQALCAREGVEATDLGRFVDSGRLTLRFEGNVVADLAMDFLHDGRPAVVREATFEMPEEITVELPPDGEDKTDQLWAILEWWDVASKEWIVRQYDHEVQGRTVIKPLVGVEDDGPGDAAVVLPVRDSTMGLAVACGICPRYGWIDPYAMALCAVDEAIRNAVAVGADPSRIALLDNFCWGTPEDPEVLGSLVLAARGCHDAAIAYRAPFISGKDSLYNSFTRDGEVISIPGTLLISAIGRVPDVRRCVTMDLKEPGNLLFLAGLTKTELGGSTWLVTFEMELAGRAPKVDLEQGPRLARAVFEAISAGLVRACHDLSDGGLAAALAEMAIAGGLGLEADLAAVPRADDAANDGVLLFSESPSRYLLEVRPEAADALARLFDGLPIARIGAVTGGDDEPQVVVRGLDGPPAIDAPVNELKSFWQRPLHPPAREDD
jgi:phosphoribosylformylglycinamidine synthase